MQSAIARQPTSLADFMNAPQETPPAQIGRVVIVSDSLPERNGVGAYYRDLLDQLEANGYEATLLCPSEDRPTLFKFPLPGDSTQRVWIPSIFRFRRVMRRVRPQNIIAATPGPYGLLGCFWSRRLDAKLIVGFHTHFSGVTDLYNNRFLRTFSRFYFGIADKILFRYGDVVLANSEGMVDLARNLGAKDPDIMGTLLPIDALAEPAAPISDEFARVVFAGRLAPEKRVQTVIDTARQLPRVHFTIAGDGPLKADVKRQAGELPNVDYVGWVSRHDLMAHVDAADLLVLPSVVESFGTVAFEAMARARLALVSENCGILDWPDLADHIYRIEGNETVAEALQRIAAIPAHDRQRVAAGARDAALKLNQRSLEHWLSVLKVDDAANSASR